MITIDDTMSPFNDEIMAKANEICDLVYGPTIEELTRLLADANKKIEMLESENRELRIANNKSSGKLGSTDHG